MTGLLDRHGDGGESRTGRRGVDRLLARPHHLPRAREAEADHRQAAGGRAADPEPAGARVRPGPGRLAPIDARPVRDRSNDADTAPRSSNRRRRCATRPPSRGPGVERHQGAEGPPLADRAGRPARPRRRRDPRARAGALRHQDPFPTRGGGRLRYAGAGRGPGDLAGTTGNDRHGLPPVVPCSGRVPIGRRRDRAMERSRFQSENPPRDQSRGTRRQDHGRRQPGGGLRSGG